MPHKDPEKEKRDKERRERQAEARKEGLPLGAGSKGGGGIARSPGLGRKEREELAGARSRRAGLPLEQQPVLAGAKGQEQFVTPEVSLATKTAAAIQLEQEGAFEQVTPTPSELTPEKKAVETIPIIGASLEATAQAIGQSIKSLRTEADTTGEEAFPIPTDPETQREEALRIIRQNSFEEGISKPEAFGSFVEAIPVVGNRARAWADGLIEQPSSNAQKVLDNIKGLGEDASTGQEKVRNGLQPPSHGLDRARQMEEDVARLEGRLKLLITTSAVLRSNTDEVNRMADAIDKVKDQIGRYKQASEFGLTAELTGTAPVPTDQQIFFELREIQEKKNE